MNKTINRFFLILLSISFIIFMVACDENDNSQKAVDYNLCSINFLNEDDSIAMPSTKIQKGNLFFPPNQPLKEDYVFAGWYKDKELTEEWNLDQPIENDVILYAKWDKLIIFCDSFSTEYKSIIEPIENAALLIIKDLYKSNKLANMFDILINPKLKSIRFCYGDSIHITIVGDKKAKDGNTSKYLKEAFVIMLEDIGDHYSYEYALAQEFFKQERLLTGKPNYQSVVKPLAQKTAEAILTLYKNYNGNIICSPCGDSETLFIDNKNKEYDLIKDFLNLKIIEKKSKIYADVSYQNMINKMPLLKDCNINISFGGINGEIKNCTFNISMGIYKLSFNFGITTTEDFSYNKIAYFCGVVKFGYWTGPDWLAPNDVEYSSFINDLMLNLPKEFYISSCYKTQYGEDTIMNLPLTPIDFLS